MPIKTKDAYIQQQPITAPEQFAQGQQSFVKEQGRRAAVKRAEAQRTGNGAVPQAGGGGAALSALQAGGTYDRVEIQGRPPSWADVFAVFAAKTAGAADSESVAVLDADTIVAVALSQVGNVGGQPYWSWYGFNSRVEWCACFVSWCANK